MKHVLIFAPLALICFGFGLTGFDDAGHRKGVKLSIAAGPPTVSKSEKRLADSDIHGFSRDHSAEKLHKAPRRRDA